MVKTINNKKFLAISTSELMNEFKKYIGWPYVYGGDGTLKECISSSCTHHLKGKKYVGYDCSGYIYKVLSKWDYNKFGRSTSQMMDNNSYGEWIYDRDNLKVGDLMFFPGHVGVVSSNVNHTIKMYHAPQCGKNLCEVDSNYRKDFIKGLRILKSNLSVKNEKDGDRMNLLILDSGHAEKVAGKNNAKENFYEWKFNFDMCEMISKRCKEHGIEVYLTNPKPQGVDEMGLTKRTELANNYWKSKNKPKAMFISVHGNAYRSESARGTETFHASNASSSSKNFAKTLNDEVYNTFKTFDSGAKNRGVKSEDFTVIYKTQTPAVLVEYGFYSNLNDLKILKNKKSELTEATVKAVCRYFGITYKSKSNSTVTETKNTTKVKVDGTVYDFEAIVKDGATYVKLRDFEKAKYKVDYINNIATINKP